MVNYFDFFEIPIAFAIDETDLRKRFIANSKKFHPDFHTLESEAEQDAVLEKSTINNQAWKTLANANKRMAHILIIKGHMPEEGQAKIPQEFLIEMMDINEALMELEFDEDPNKKEEVLTSMSKAMKSDNNKYIIPIKHGSKSYKQIHTFQNNDTIFQHIEVYKKLNSIR